MAVIRYQPIDDNTVNYVATLAFFCSVSCVTLMLKFGRFKTSFNVYSGNKQKTVKGQDDLSSSVSINGAYRTNRDEFFVYGNSSEPQRKSTPAAVAGAPPPPPMPTKQAHIRQTKSTSDLIKEQDLPANLRGAQSGVSLDPRGAETDNRNNNTQAANPKNKKQLDAQKRVEKQRLEEQKKLEKQRLAEQKKLEKQRADEQKKRDKLAQQERAKQEKLRKEREKKEAQLAKKNKKGQAPQKPLANPLAQSSTQPASNARSQPSSTQYSTNTLESSISKTSGPPPYAEESEQGNSNVTYSKPVDTGSWDMISQHRNVINRPTKRPAPTPKMTTMDLNYILGEEGNKENSDA